MEHNSKFLFFILLVVSLILPNLTFAASPATVVLGTAGNFVVLSKTLITTTGTTAITGDIGVSPAAATFIQGFSLIADPSNQFSTSTYVTGKVYAADYAVPTPTVMSTAISDMETAYNDAAGRTPISEPIDTRTSTLPLGTTFTTGIYKWSTSVNITGDITLSGSASDVFIFQIAGNLDISANKKVLLTGGALASNIFWAVAGTTTLEAGSNFEGTILGGPAVSTIAMQSLATLDGRALGQKDVSLIANTISALAPVTPPAHLIVIKHVINNNTGASTASNFTTTISGVTTATPTAAGAESPGVDNVLTSVGAYSIDEGAHAGYNKSLSANCSGTIALGQTKTCTITNDDIDPVTPATITVIKVVVGGTKVTADFPLFVNATAVVSGATNVFPVGTYTISETKDPTYTQSFSGNCPNGTLVLVSGGIEVCTITNTFIPFVPSGSGALNTSLPTTSLVPPLIDIVKVPSPLALPNGPGLVTYTYTLHNTGTVPVTDITMIEDSCGPVTFVSGDTNNDKKLDVNETWVYTCATTLTQTHTNIVTVTGWANGISAVDVASATVVVGAPVVPPLIHVTKVPNPLLLSVSGGVVTYTEKITNPGTVPLNNVHIADDKCAPVQYISGDTNGNLQLDMNETWTYICTAHLATTTTNTVTVDGSANGLTTKDFAIATVVVSATPGLPKTGYPPEEKNNLWYIIQNFLSSFL